MTQHPAGASDAKAAAPDESGLWATLADPMSDAAFHAAWLALLCQRATGIESGLLVLRKPDQTLAPAAVWPHLRQDIRALADTAESAVKEAQPVFQPLNAERGGGLVLAYPLRGPQAVDGVVVLATVAGGRPDVGRLVRQMHWAGGLIETTLLRRAAGDGDRRLIASRKAFDALAAVQDETDLQRANFALVNELAQATGATRVSLGIIKSGAICLATLSNAAKFDRRSEAAHQLELVMDECLVQGEIIHFPPRAGGRRQIAIAHEMLAREQSRSAVLSVPLKLVGRQPAGVIVLEFDEATDLAVQEATEATTLLATLSAPYLHALQDGNRLFSGRGVRFASKSLRAVFGPRRPGLKLVAAGIALSAAWLSLVPMPFWISARAVVEGEMQRAAVAPFEGFILRASVRAGDTVSEGQEMASLDDRDLKFEKLKWESEKQKLEQRQREALAKFDRATVQVLTAQIEQTDAELRIVEEKLNRARILAPIGGYVVSGDLSQLFGSPVQQGKVLFEIAPLNQYRVALSVDEVDIRHLKDGMTGGLTLTGAGDAVPIALTRHTSVTTPKDGRNTFRTEARLQTTPTNIRPGMEGVAKLDAGKAPLLWTWSRTLVDRIRLSIWSWMP